MKAIWHLIGISAILFTIVNQVMIFPVPLWTKYSEFIWIPLFALDIIYLISLLPGELAGDAIEGTFDIVGDMID